MLENQKARVLSPSRVQMASEHAALDALHCCLLMCWPSVPSSPLECGCQHLVRLGQVPAPAVSKSRQLLSAYPCSMQVRRLWGSKKALCCAVVCSCNHSASPGTQVAYISPVIAEKLQLWVFLQRRTKQPGAKTIRQMTVLTTRRQGQQSCCYAGAACTKACAECSDSLLEVLAGLHWHSTAVRD